jgi:RNA recognition motif-containing protein
LKTLTLYVGNLAHETRDVDLRAAFSRFGDVVSARIVSDRRGRTKGFGYVEMTDRASAEVAMENLRGTQLNGRTLDIVPEERTRRSSAGSARARRRR